MPSDEVEGRGGGRDKEVDIETFGKMVDKLGKRLGKVLDQYDAKTLEDECSPGERARLNLVLAKAINILYSMHLQCKGIGKDEHPMLRDLKRVDAMLGLVDDSLRQREEGGKKAKGKRRENPKRKRSND